MKTLMPILNVMTGQWMLGYSEHFRATPMTKAELDEHIADYNRMKNKENNSEDRDSSPHWAISNIDLTQ